MEFYRRLFVPPRRRFIFLRRQCDVLRRLRDVLRRLRNGDAWRNAEWGRPMNGRQKGERFFLDRKIAQSEARNFLPVKYANFVRCCFCDFRLRSFAPLAHIFIPPAHTFFPLLILLFPLLILFCSPCWVRPPPPSDFFLRCFWGFAFSLDAQVRLAF